MLTMLKKMLAKMVVIATALVSMHAFAADTPYDLTVEVSDKLFKNITSNQAKIKQDPNYLKTIVRGRTDALCTCEICRFKSVREKF